jgi:DNA topoisomerase-1
MKLVIVESPAKCSKIQSYLGDGYIVKATMGHIRALEESLDSVGIDREWDPHYVELSAKKDAITKLRSAAKGAEVILATDDDREGEGIAWHVCCLLKLNPATTPRIVFHEITKPAIQAAVAAPRLLDMNKVNAQQARAMLDLLVGFTISKVLWNRVAPKLSAGRCQTPALRLVVERDVEVEQHKAAAFWRLSGTWALPCGGPAPLDAQSVEDVPDRATAEAALRTVYGAQGSVITAVKESVSISNPPKPFITSTLQQDASSTHGLNPKVTMQAAQKLYEAGLITYMRTDNPVLSEEAADAIRAHITSTYGTDYVGAPGQHTSVSVPSTTGPTAAAAVGEPAAKKPKKPAKKAAASAAPDVPAAQAAHEAIRPTHPEDADPAIVDDVQRIVYKLIWRRAIQCQMAPARHAVRKITLAIDADADRLYETQQTKPVFLGWQITEPKDPKKTAALEEAWAAWTPFSKPRQALKWTSLQADEQFTKPRGRFTEASLIAELEKRGIGRPSTFASLVSTILDRGYVEKTNAEGKPQACVHLVLAPSKWPPTETTTEHKVGADRNKLRSTALGRSVVDFLGKEYNDLFAYDFTAGMESDLDAISHGTKAWKSLLQTTWDTYKERYATMTTGGAVARAARERPLGDGLKVILSAKGPLFVREPPPGSPKSQKATFAPLLSGTAYESVSAEDAEAAFAAAAAAKLGEAVGEFDGETIRRKRGPYGLYAECKGARVPLKGDEDVERIKEKLIAKISFAAAGEAAYSRTVSDFTIKRGPYGLYFYKHALKRVQFVKFPAAMNPDTVTATDLTNLYSAGIASKRRGGGGGRPAKKGGGTTTAPTNEIV